PPHRQRLRTVRVDVLGRGLEDPRAAEPSRHRSPSRRGEPGPDRAPAVVAYVIVSRGSPLRHEAVELLRQYRVHVQELSIAEGFPQGGEDRGRRLLRRTLIDAQLRGDG